MLFDNQKQKILIQKNIEKNSIYLGILFIIINKIGFTDINDTPPGLGAVLLMDPTHDLLDDV